MTQEAKQKIEKFFIIAFLLLMTLDFGGKYFKSEGQLKSPQDTPIQQNPPTNPTDDEFKDDSSYSKQQGRGFETIDNPEPAKKQTRKQKERSFEENFGNIITISYCTQWLRNLFILFNFALLRSYSKAFQQMKQIIEDKYPQLNVVGGNHPPTGIKQLLCKLIGYVQWGLIILLFAGDYAFAYFKMPYPQFYLKMKQNKIISFIVIFLLGNSITGMMQSTGAFEVMYGDQMIFSKLQTGRMPNMEELFKGIEKFIRR